MSAERLLTLDLQSLRLITKRSNSSATKALFTHVEVKPTEESCRKCLNIMDHAELSKQVTSISFHTSLNPAASSREEDEDEEGDDVLIRVKGSRQHIKPFYKALSNVSKFEKLQHVSINFAERCASGEDWYNDADEDITVRSRVLRALYGDAKLPEKLHSLSIRNLQDLLPDFIADSVGWVRLLGKLDCLGLWITNEGDDAAPERNLEFKQLHQFYRTDLKAKILAPVRQRLKELKLYANEIYWGHYPMLDLRDPEMQFPKLETMALNKLAFVFDWQVDWILSHAATLKTLVLDDCPIILAGNAFQDMSRPSEAPPNGIITADNISWINATRWHHIFDKFKNGLPHLRHFAIRTTNIAWLDHVAEPIVDSFEDMTSLENELQVSRYRLFDAGIGPDQIIDIQHPDLYAEDVGIQYPQDTSEGKLAFFNHAWWEEDFHGFSEEQKAKIGEGAKFPDCWKQDSEALRELVEVVDGRRR